MYEEIRKSARTVLLELLDVAALKPGQQVVIGCSSSEIMGQKIGKGSTPEAAKAVVDEIMPILKARGLCLEAQCCEHLNRALIMERADAERFGYEIVCVRPRPKAGGSFATAVYEAMDDPVAVEFVKADAGLDIGNTMIGMHLKHVAVPLRLSVKTIGEAPVNAARTRPKLIGGRRAESPHNGLEKRAPPAKPGGAAFLQLRRKLRALVHQDGQHQRQDDKDEAEPFRRLGKLGIERLGFAFGKERFRTAGNGAGQAGALAGLHQHDHGHGETGNQLDNRQNQFQSSHGIHPFMIGKII